MGAKIQNPSYKPPESSFFHSNPLKILQENNYNQSAFLEEKPYIERLVEVLHFPLYL